MKKKIFLWIILLLEIAIFISLGVFNSYPNLKTTIPFNGVYLVGGYSYLIADNLMKAIHLDDLLTNIFHGTYQNLFIFISLFLFNLVFVGVYYLIFGILTIVFNKKKEKKIREVVKPYELSNSEYEKFNYKNYFGNAPIKRIISLIIPILFITLFVFVRFDSFVCIDASSNISGVLNVWNEILEPAVNNFLEPLNVHELVLNIFHNANSTGYIDLVNKFLSAAPWVEYAVIVVAGLVILALWFGLFSLINLATRKPFARRKAKKARAKYIRKMERIEYKLHSKYKEETNIKAEDFMHIIEKEQNDAAKEIAMYRKEKETEEQLQTKDNEKNKLSYYEEIGQGVNDLGVSNDLSMDYKPLTEREVKYISDEEIDIILDEEPVIEVVENDEEDPLEVGKNDIFYERYQPDDVEIETVEEYSGLEYGVKNIFEKPIEEEKDELVDNSPIEEPIIEETSAPIEVEKVGETPSTEEEQVIEETPAIEEEQQVVDKTPIEEESHDDIVAPLDETPVEEVEEIPTEEEKEEPTKIVIEEDVLETLEEEPVKEEETIQEEQNEIEEEPTPIVEETPTVEDPIQEEVKKEEAPAEEEIIEVNEEDIIQEKPVEQPKKKSFADYINRGKKTTQPQNDNGFSKFINRRNDPGYGAKKVPSFKEIEAEKKAKEPKVVYVTEDPFKDYRDRKNNPGYGAKKVPSFKDLEANKKEEK